MDPLALAPCSGQMVLELSLPVLTRTTLCLAAGYFSYRCGAGKATLKHLMAQSTLNSGFLTVNTEYR